MEILGVLAAVLLSLVAFSAGSVTLPRCRERRPALLDLVLAVACAGGAVAARGQLGHWPGLAAGVAGSGIVGVLGSLPGLWRSEGRSARGDDESAPSGFRDRLRRFGLAMGNYQGRMFMGILYFVMLTPVGIVSRSASDPLELDGEARGTGWHHREAEGEEAADLGRLRSQS